MNHFQVFVLAVAGLTGAASLSAQSSITTDRPGLLFSASTVGDAVWQVETGVPFVRDEADGSDSRSESLVVALRYGLGERWELRFGTALSQVDFGESEIRGVGDLELGAKVMLRNGAGGGPTVALIPSVILPTGDDDLSAGDPIGTLNGVVALPLAGGWSSTLLLGVRGGELEEESFLDVVAAGLVGRSLPWEGWSGYLEAGVTRLDEGSSVGLVGAGVAYLVDDDVQLDLSFGRGVNDLAPDWRFEVGASVRF